MFISIKILKEGVTLSIERSYIITLDNGMQISVSPEIYSAYYRPEWREHKREQRDRQRILSYDRFLVDGFPVENHMSFKAENVEDIIMKKLTLEKLRFEISLLSEKEQQLIRELYGNKLSEREYAQKYNMPASTVHMRKKRILENLKKKMQ